MAYHTIRWCGPEAAVHAALAELGHPVFGATPAPEPGEGEVRGDPTPPDSQDPRIAAWGPTHTASVAGVPVCFTILRATEAVPVPPGLYDAEKVLADGTVGDWMTPPAPQVPDDAPAPRTLLTLAFWRRFPEAKRGAIAASEDPVVRTIVATLGMSQEVELDDPEVTGGLSYLVGVGLLEEAERDAALA